MTGPAVTGPAVAGPVGDRPLLGGGPLFGGSLLVEVAALVVILAGLRAAAPVLVPAMLALFVTVLGLPLLRALRGRGLPAGPAVLVTVLAVLGLLAGLGFLVSLTLNDFAQAAPSYLEQLVGKVRGTLDALERQNVPVSSWFALEPIDPQALVDLASGILGGTVKGVASALAAVTLVVLTVIFVMAEAVIFEAKIAVLRGPGGRLPAYVATLIREVERYLGIKTVISLATGVLLGAWVAALGIPFPLLWGLTAFLFNYVPAIGSIVAAVPPVLLALVQFGGGRAAAVAAGYLAVNFLLGNLLEPRVMGRRFGLSTLVVFLALIFWGWLWGPVGMLLSVPLMVMLKLALEQSRRWYWLAVLLGPGPGSSPPVSRTPPAA